MIVNGHNYKITHNALLPLQINIDPPRETTDPVLLVEGIEDITGEYMNFYINSKHICTTPHINHFDNIDDIARWFIETELEY